MFIDPLGHEVLDHYNVSINLARTELVDSDKGPITGRASGVGDSRQLRFKQSLPFLNRITDLRRNYFGRLNLHLSLSDQFIVKRL